MRLIATRSTVICWKVTVVSSITLCILLLVKAMYSDEDGVESLTSWDVEQGFKRARSVLHRTNDTETYEDFDPDQPRQILILAYQGGGVEFFGAMLGHHPRAIYAYQPLDGLYVDTYDTKEGWNVPSDITNYSNGSARILPYREIDDVMELLDFIFNCEIGNIPITVLYHKARYELRSEYASLDQFSICNKHRHSRARRCRKTAFSALCPGRFDPSNAKVDACRQSLDDLWESPTTDESPIKDYVHCLKGIRVREPRCVKNMKQLCVDAEFRVITTVRATMSSVEELIERNPNLRIIHLIRDPRPVMLARRTSGQSSFGLYSTIDTDQQVDLAKEAMLYCSTVLRDVRERRKLQAIYPGIIREVIYDDFMYELVNNARQLYRFVDIPFTESTEQWILNNTINADVVQWQSEISSEESRSIRDNCQELFDAIAYKMSS